MHLTLTITWVVGIVAELAIVALILRKRLAFAWPSVLAYCLWDLAADVALECTPHATLRYVQVYWGWYIASSILRLWVLGDIVRSFPGSDFMRRNILIVASSAAAIILSCALYVARSSSPPWYQSASIFTHLLDTSTSFATAGVVAVTLALIAWKQLGWSRRGAITCYGLSLKMFCAIWSAQLLAATATPAQHSAGALLRAFGAVGTLLFWLWSVARPECTLTLPAALTVPTGHKQGLPRKLAS